MTETAAPAPPVVQHAHVELGTAATIQLTGTQVEIFHALHEKIIWDFHELGEVHDLQGFGNWAKQFRTYCHTLNLTARISQIDNTLAPTSPPNAIDMHHAFAIAKNVIELLNDLASLPPSPPPAPATAAPTPAAGASGSHTPRVPPQFAFLSRQLGMLEDLLADFEAPAPAPSPSPGADSASGTSNATAPASSSGPSAAPTTGADAVSGSSNASAAPSSASTANASSPPPPQPPPDFDVPRPEAEMAAERQARRARVASTPAATVQSQQDDRNLLRRVLAAGRSVPSGSTTTPVPRPDDLASLSGPHGPVVQGLSTYARTIGPAGRQTDQRMANAIIAKLNSRTDQHQVDRYGHLQAVAFFCHGWQEGMQLGLRPGAHGNLQAFATAVAAVADPDAKFRVVLYCCSTGASPHSQVDPHFDAEHDHNNDQHGAGSLAEALCDALRTAGLTDVQVDAHRNVGSAVANPLVRRFATTDFGYPPPSDPPPAPPDAHARGHVSSPEPIQPIDGIHRIDLGQYPPTLTEIPGTPELPASPGEIRRAMTRNINRAWIDPPPTASAEPLVDPHARHPGLLWAAYPFHDVATVRRYLAPTVMAIRQDEARAAAARRSVPNPGARR